MPDQPPKYITIHEDGKINLNRNLNGEIQSREIEIGFNKKGDKILLIPNGGKCHKFGKNGCAQNPDIVQVLQNKHVSVSVTYEVKWDKENSVWTGDMRDTPAVRKRRDKRSVQSNLVTE